MPILSNIYSAFLVMMRRYTRTHTHTHINKCSYTFASSERWCNLYIVYAWLSCCDISYILSVCVFVWMQWVAVRILHHRKCENWLNVRCPCLDVDYTSNSQYQHISHAMYNSWAGKLIACVWFFERGKGEGRGGCR